MTGFSPRSPETNVVVIRRVMPITQMTHGAWKGPFYRVGTGISAFSRKVVKSVARKSARKPGRYCFVDPLGSNPSLVTAQALSRQAQALEDPTDLSRGKRTPCAAELACACKRISYGSVAQACANHWFQNSTQPLRLSDGLLLAL